MPTTEVKDRKAFIRVGISLAKKSIATASQAESEQKRQGTTAERAVGFIDWLEGSTSPHKTPCTHYAAEDTEQDHRCECI
jgi:hypothetical protein